MASELCPARLRMPRQGPYERLPRGLPALVFRSASVHPTVWSVHGQGAGRRHGPSNCWMVCPMSTGGRALRPPKERRRHPLSARPPAPGRLTEKAPHRATQPFLRTPPVEPHPACRLRVPGPYTYPPCCETTGRAPSRPPDPARTRKTPPPRPASRARPPPPPPRIRTRSVSTPEDRVRKMIPAPVGGTCGPEVLAALPLIQHRCGKVNTLVGVSGGFFCHFRDLRAPCNPGLPMDTPGLLHPV